MSSNKEKTHPGESVDFESVLQQLEGIINTLEQEDTSLEASLVAFEKGVKLARDGQKTLASAEQQVSLLLEQSGAPVEQDFAAKDIDE